MPSNGVAVPLLAQLQDIPVEVEQFRIRMAVWDCGFEGLGAMHRATFLCESLIGIMKPL